MPVFLRSLQIAKDALEAGYTAIARPSINPESSWLDKEWRGLKEESYKLMQEIITQKVATAGILMDTMLDALEGREDVLPEKWIAELEDVEEGVGRWQMDGERVVLEGRLRLEEMIIRQSGIEEEAREREKTLLVSEQGRSAQEARAEEEESAIEVMEKAEEMSDIVEEAMSLSDDDESDWIEPNLENSTSRSLGFQSGSIQSLSSSSCKFIASATMSFVSSAFSITSIAASSSSALASCAPAALRRVTLSTLQKWVGHWGGN